MLLAGGMLNITATYSRIISATGRSGKGEGEEEMVVCLPAWRGGRRSGTLEGIPREEGPRDSDDSTCDFKYVHRLCASAVSRNEPFGFPWPCPLFFLGFLRSLDGQCSPWSLACHVTSAHPVPGPNYSSVDHSTLPTSLSLSRPLSLSLSLSSPRRCENGSVSPFYFSYVAFSFQRG